VKLHNEFALKYYNLWEAANPEAVALLTVGRDDVVWSSDDDDDDYDDYDVFWPSDEL